MKKKLKRFLTLLLATCMLLNTVSISLADDWKSEPLAPSEGKFTKSKTATDWIDDVYADVTLNVGGNSEDMSSDIVFIIGNGPSYNYGYVLDMIHRMLVATDGTPTKIKIGMVGFADTTADETLLPLTEMKDVVAGNQVSDYRIAGRYNDGKQYTESAEDYRARKATAFAAWEAENPLLLQDMDYIVAKALERAEDVYSGVNLESSLITARDMLVADNTVPADRKHMIAVSTGLTYWFDNDAGEPVTIIGTSIGKDIMHGNKYWLRARNNSTNTSSGYKIPSWAEIKKDGAVSYQGSWGNYWDMIVDWIEADQNSYVYNPQKTFSDFFYNGNSTEIYPLNNKNHRYGYAIQNEEDLAKVTGAVPYFDGGANPATNKNAAHALNYERAQYEAWVVYKQMETPIGESFTTVLGDTITGLGFNCYSIANGVSSNPGEEDRWLSSNQIGYNFMHMLGGENTVNYRDGDNSFFAPIENKILHRLSSGTYVEDYIGYNDDPEKGDIYDFDFVDVDNVGDAGTPVLKIGGKEYFTEKLEEPNEGATSTYAFSSKEGEEPTFWLNYFEGNLTTEERFQWVFGEDVLHVAPASLTYRVKIKEKAEIPGTYTVYTNQSATLYPKDSLQNEGRPELFEIPELKYEVKGVDVKVTKNWDDESNRDRKRPESITVQLYADGQAQGEPITLKSSNKWSYTWTKLRAVKNGTPIVYTVDETAVPEPYTKDGISGDIATGFIITNSYEPEITSVSVNKVWNDADNQDGLRTKDVTVQLKANNKNQGEPVILNSDNGWAYTWPDLWKNEAGVEIEYTVVEINVPAGYEASVETAATGEADINYTITNTHAPAVISIDVTKEWEDADNVDNIQPIEVVVQLYADEVAIGEPVTLSAANEWKHEWTNLTKYKVGAEGQLVTYEVKEINVPEYYEAGIEKNVTETTNSFTITNTHEPFETEVTVTKEWNDGDDQDGIRPAEVQVQLYADGAKKGKAVTLNEVNNWTYTWENLPVNKKGENGENGVAINYTVDELGTDKLEKIGYTKEEITGNAENGYTITNTHTPAETQVMVTKVWEDADNQDNLRPTEITVQLYAGEYAEGEAVTLNAANEWTYTWTELPVNAAGEPIEYTVKETTVSNGYTAETTVTGDADAGYTVTITNTHIPAVITVDVTKEWKDGDNVDNIRPTEVAVQLYVDDEANGEPVILNESNNWTYEWTDLTKYRVGKVGELVVYEVKEVNIPENYKETIDKKVSETTNSFIITNTHKPFETEVTVTKEWNDDKNRDNVRPEEIQVQLYEVQDNVMVPVKEPVTLNKDNNWTYTWNNLPVNKNGENGEHGIAIEYTVDELGTEQLAEIGYIKEAIKGDATNGFTITNTREIDTTEVSVEKKWDDNNNRFKLRPESIQVQLYKFNDAGKMVPVQDAVTLDANNNWKYTFTELPVNEKGKEGVAIRYTVKEVETPEYYESTLTGTAKAGFIITNKLLRTSLTLTKRIDQTNPEKATAIFRYLITGPENYRANVTINFESGTVKVDGVVQSTDKDLSDNIGFDKEGLTVTLENLQSGDYTITEYAARGYQLVQMADEEKDAPKASAKAINGVQNKMTVTTTVDAPGAAYYWNRYKAPSDYTAVNRFSVSELGNLNISIKRK